MRWKRIAACTLALSLLSGSAVFAESAIQKIKVMINGTTVSGGGYLIDGTTYVPVREFDGLAEYSDSSKTVSFTKPNVDIFLFKGDTVFGNVNVGKLKFYIFSQVDSLNTSISSVKVSIRNPSGDVKDIQSQDLSSSKDNFWFKTYDFTYDFSKAGKYYVEFYIKKDNGSYSMVAQKAINAVE
ncbi:copper amine oxidase [Saccharibacillus sp. CPCC 101409]|uniref:copper amine oxidase n=1 Tax=Saccharibacillus sp. CPCC 101409 TaxID=3058041 RepID=UPI00267122A5|nr:copper amine oxidase [Saccharibacillus sp. CPCC 101409]MDO3409335.1 copper amine oxidase [Saccharibacillus sp. CPCC 101409]